MAWIHCERFDGTMDVEKVMCRLCFLHQRRLEGISYQRIIGIQFTLANLAEVKSNLEPTIVIKIRRRMD